MSAGIPVTKTVVDNLAGASALGVDQYLDQAVEIKRFLDSFANDAAVIAWSADSVTGNPSAPWTQTDVDTLRGFSNAYSLVRQAMNNEINLAQDDYNFHAKKLTGIAGRS